MTNIWPTRTALTAEVEQISESISETFHENTKLTRVGSDTAVVPGEYTTQELQGMAAAYKRYRLHERIMLPPPDTHRQSSITFDEAMRRRRTIRSFSAEALDIAELSILLQHTYGITGQLPVAGGGTQFLRSAPSAGALYPAEIYMGIRQVAGVAPGIYHYEVLEHSIALLTEGDPTEALYEVCCRQEQARNAAVTFFVSGTFERTKRKYGERGYRYVLLDVGHLSQNLCLSCTSLGLGAMTTCGFYDDAASTLLRLDGITEAVLYVAFVGKAPTTDGNIPEGALLARDI